VEDGFRDEAEITSALLEPSIFENCRPVMLAGKIGLLCTDPSYE
jgi:hypothetical protein